MEKRKRKIKRYQILLVILIIIFIYSSYNVFMWVRSDRKLKNLEGDLYKEVVKTSENNENETEEGYEEDNKGSISVDFEKLKQINSDVIGWIKINDTYINYPILQGETDEYYLKRDIYGSYNLSGSIFVYSSADRNFNDENTAIFGHNMKNQRMFAQLKKIYNGELGQDINVEICTENGTRIYKVFSCYIQSPDLEIVQSEFAEQEKTNYIDTAIEKSKIDFKQSIDYSKKIITLITCSANGSKRLVVNAIES